MELVLTAESWVQFCTLLAKEISSMITTVCFIALLIDRYNYLYIYIYIPIQGVPGGMDKTSGECSLC